MVLLHLGNTQHGSAVSDPRRKPLKRRVSKQSSCQGPEQFNSNGCESHCSWSGWLRCCQKRMEFSVLRLSFSAPYSVYPWYLSLHIFPWERALEKVQFSQITSFKRYSGNSFNLKHLSQRNIVFFPQISNQNSPLESKQINKKLFRETKTSYWKIFQWYVLLKHV